MPETLRNEAWPVIGAAIWCHKAQIVPTEPAWACADSNLRGVCVRYVRMTVVYRFIVLCVLSLSASLAATAQQVELSAPGAEEELVAALRANSLLLRDNEENGAHVAGHRRERARGLSQAHGHALSVRTFLACRADHAGRARGRGPVALRRSRPDRTDRDQRGYRPGIHLRLGRDRAAGREHAIARGRSGPAEPQRHPYCRRPRVSLSSAGGNRGARSRKSRTSASPHAMAMRHSMPPSRSRRGLSSASVS